MTERFITPPNGRVVEGHFVPVVFLAGPIQGSPDWQTPTAAQLIGQHERVVVASPRRAGVDKDFDYREQVTWEKQHLERAAMVGHIAFWFAAQDASLPYEAGRAYAQTTRIEIGRVFGWRDSGMYRNLKISVGFEPGYDGGSKRYIETMCEEESLPIHASLDSLTSEILDRLA